MLNKRRGSRTKLKSYKPGKYRSTCSFLKSERMKVVFFSCCSSASKTASLKTKFQAYYRTRRFIIVFTKADYGPCIETDKSIPHFPTLNVQDQFQYHPHNYDQQTLDRAREDSVKKTTSDRPLGFNFVQFNCIYIYR